MAAMRAKQTTLKDIARELGICYSTVSRALSTDPRAALRVAKKTRSRIREKAAEMDYHPNLLAQGIVTGRSGTLGLLTYEIDREVLGRQTASILRAAEQMKYQILASIVAHQELRMSTEDQVRHIKQLLSRGVEGLLIHARFNKKESKAILESVQGRVPVVTFQHRIPDLSSVVLDDRAGFREATEHLIRSGHERIGFVGTRWDRNFAGSEKGKGYLQAMSEHGLTPKRIPGKTFPARPGHGLGKRLADRFTALVCRNDYVALGVCGGVREAGLRVPEDVAVVGYGDIKAGGFFTPGLTTMAIPHEGVAEAAMELILEQLRGDDDAPPRQVTLRPRLVVRESCGARSGGA